MSEWTEVDDAAEADYWKKGNIIGIALRSAYRDKHGEDPPLSAYFYAAVSLTEPSGLLHLMDAHKPREGNETACNLKPHVGLNYLNGKWPLDEDLIEDKLPTTEFCSVCAKNPLPFLVDTRALDARGDLEGRFGE